MEQLNDHTEIIVATLSLKKQTIDNNNNNKNRLRMPKIKYTQSYIKQVHTQKHWQLLRKSKL